MIGAAHVAEIMTDEEWAEAERFAARLSAYLNSNHTWSDDLDVDFEGHKILSVVNTDEDQAHAWIQRGPFFRVVKIEVSAWEAHDFYPWVDKSRRNADEKHVAAAQRFAESEFNR